MCCSTDRADLKLKIGLPGPYARYKILKSCTQELMRAGIISPWESFQDLDPDSPSFITTVSHGNVNNCLPQPFKFSLLLSSHSFDSRPPSSSSNMRWT